MKKQKKDPKPENLVTIKEALQIVWAHYRRRIYTKGTIYNKISRGELNRYGPYHMAMLDRNEVESKLCS
jgi:hypothetical protein